MTGSFEEPKAVPAPGAISLARLEEPAPPSKPDLRSASALYPGENVIRLDRVMPAKVPLNVPFDYTLKVTNLTETPVQDVVVTEHRPENFKLQGADPQPDKKNGTFSWVLGTLEAKASREIKISGVATTADTLIPCATVTFLVPISVYGNVAVVEPKLVLTATVPKEVLLCEPIPAQIVVTNPGTGDLEAVTIVETLPAGLATMEGASKLILEAGTLAPGQSKQFASSFKASKTGEFVSKAVASARGGLKAEATATTIVRRPVLALTKTGPARQYLGRPITYEITVTNKGDAPAADAVVEDAVASGVQTVQPSAGGEVADTKVVWQLGTLAVGASQKVSVTYIPLEAGLLAQAATASAVGAEAVTARAETVVYGIAGVHVDVIDTNDPVPVGGRTTYVITVTNQGSSPSHNVQITATVEEAEEIVATSGATAVSVEGRTARCAPLASLVPEAQATWMVTVKARKAGDVRFRVTMTTAELGRPVEEMEATQLFE
jgi:uncharacterized repeat protein (TIGR01451 family)